MPRQLGELHPCQQQEKRVVFIIYWKKKKISSTVQSAIALAVVSTRVLRG